MPPLRLSDEDAARLRALVILQRYSLGLDRVADQALGNRGTDNLDLQILLTIDALDDGGPSDARLRAGPPAKHGVARAGTAARAGLIERTTHALDRRRAALHLTERGRRGVERFEPFPDRLLRRG